MKTLSLKSKLSMVVFAMGCIAPAVILAQHQHSNSCLENNTGGFNPAKERQLLKEKGIQDWEIDKALELKMKNYTACSIKSIPSYIKPAPQGPGQACGNGDFELGNLNSWDSWTGDVFNPNFGRVLMGQQSGRQEVVSGATVDPYGGFPMVNPAGGAYSVRLGNDSAGGRAEVLEQVFAVTANNTNFKYTYAVVFESTGHDSINSPKLIAGIYDMNGQLVPNSRSLEYDNGQVQPGYSNFTSLPCPGYYGCMAKTSSGIYKPWTTVTVNLSAYIGQDVTMRFETRDCGAGGHFGYGYLDADCMAGALSQIEYSHSEEVSIYPNPANTMVNVHIGKDVDFMNSRFEMMDGLGRVVYTTTVDKPQFAVNTTGLAGGMYFYHLIAKDSNLLSKGKIIIE